MIRSYRLSLRVAMLAAAGGMVAAAAPGAAQAAPAGPGASAAMPSANASQAPAATVELAPPQPGATPAAIPVIDSFAAAFLYTGTDMHVYSLFERASLGGRLIGGPAARDEDSPVLGRGADNALWMGGHGGWSSLGGRLTSRPAFGASGVIVRGADGAVWTKGLNGGRWTSLGGRLLTGSGPAGLYVGSTVYVLAVGTDRAVWARHSSDHVHWSSWRSLGGRVSHDVAAAVPALPVGQPPVGVVFARGTDNAVWYKEFAGMTPGVTPGWHSLGGRLHSGVSTTVGPPSYDDQVAFTHVVVLGTDNHIWELRGAWPDLAGWFRES